MLPVCTLVWGFAYDAEPKIDGVWMVTLDKSTSVCAGGGGGLCISVALMKWTEAALGLESIRVACFESSCEGGFDEGVVS